MTENTPRSWKGIRSQRRGALFIGRREQLATFRANFGGDAPAMVFAVSGEGGVGKSTLLGQFAAIAGGPEVGALSLLARGLPEQTARSLREPYSPAFEDIPSQTADEAVELLRAAIDLDPIARIYALRDDLLAPLRERPDVQALLAAPPGPPADPAA